MDDSILSEDLTEAFRPIVEMNNARFRQVKTMLAGFIATQERDMNYMDGYMDALFDFMDPESDTEMLMRRYYGYIATFVPKEARRQIDSLDEEMGYMTKIVYAAGMVAQKLHKGQIDKGGHDYFEAHLLKVANAGFNWKEKIVGFLHDASEDCNVTVEEIMVLLDEEILMVVNNPKEYCDEAEWREEWMEDITTYPTAQTHVMTIEERDEIKSALTLLNHHTAYSREEYINRISKKILAMKVKLNDLRSNMDITRISEPTEKDYERIERYKKEYIILMEALRNC